MTKYNVIIVYKNNTTKKIGTISGKNYKEAANKAWEKYPSMHGHPGYLETTK